LPYNPHDFHILHGGSVRIIYRLPDFPSKQPTAAKDLSMNLLVISAAVAAASFMVFQPAKAETVNTIADLQNNKKTAAYVNSRTMYETMFRLGVEQDRKFGLYPNCKSQYLVKPFSVAVFSPIDFPDDKRHPIKGVWQFRYQLERCGDSKFYNALFIANGT
jgi:hypothetical protein